MAKYRTVQTEFWSDPYIEELSAYGKLLYLYLFTSPYTQNTGVLKVTVRKIAYETGATVEDTEAALVQFERDGKIIRDCATIWIINFIKNQTNTSPKIIVGLQEDIKSITSEKIKSAVYRKYPHLFDKEPEGYVPSPQDKERETEDTISAKNTDAASKPHTPSIPYAYPIDTVYIPSPERERECEKEKEREREEKDNGEHRHCEPVGSASPAPVPPSSPPVPKAQQLPECPHEQIISLYHEILPEMRPVKVWTPARQKILRARWKEARERQNLDWWRDYFLLVRASDFLMGKRPGKDGGAPFMADMEWIIRPNNMVKILEGRYSNGDRKRCDITQMSYEEALRDYPDPFGLHAEEKAKLDAIEISAEEEWT